MRRFTWQQLTEEDNGAVHVMSQGESDIWLDPQRGVVVPKHETRTSEDLPGVRTIGTQLVA
jgi:hypothetical protein